MIDLASIIMRNLRVAIFFRRIEARTNLLRIFAALAQSIDQKKRGLIIATNFQAEKLITTTDRMRRERSRIQIFIELGLFTDRRTIDRSTMRSLRAESSMNPTEKYLIQIFVALRQSMVMGRSETKAAL